MHISFAHSLLGDTAENEEPSWIVPSAVGFSVGFCAGILAILCLAFVLHKIIFKNLCQRRNTKQSYITLQ